jgi:hypothetical protein
VVARQQSALGHSRQGSGTVQPALRARVSARCGLRNYKVTKLQSYEDAKLRRCEWMSKKYWDQLETVKL